MKVQIKDLAEGKKMKDSMKKLWTILLALVLAAALAACGIPTETTTDPDETTTRPDAAPTASQHQIVPISEAQVGSYVLFGSYEQDNDTANGKEDIEWLVLAKEDGRVLLISGVALDYQPYNTIYASVTWENCSLRTWLNGPFLNIAFSGSERAMIPGVTVSADEDSGDGTTDQVFLLSITEANKYFSSDSARQCRGTAYCYAKAADKAGNEKCGWWLRSHGGNSYASAYVRSGGSVSSEGRNVRSDDIAVRPALWIDLGA